MCCGILQHTTLADKPEEQVSYVKWGHWTRRAKTATTSRDFFEFYS